MGWETRKRGGSYYTRSKREGDRVVREYVGTGSVAQLTAQLDELNRLQKEEEELEERWRRERMVSAAAFLEELERAVKTMTAAHLVAAGARKYKGQWRFKKT